MQLLAWRLRRAGFEVAQLDYPSTRMDLAGATHHVRRALRRIAPGRPVDLVGHSMGGLIAVNLLRDPGELKIGRVVQIGSPNLGSALADRVHDVGIVRRICGPALKDLLAREGSPEEDDRIAAIAGTAGWPSPGLVRPHDGTVSARSAHAGAVHRATVPVIHSLLPLSQRVADLTARFLRTGHLAEAAA